MRRLLIVCSAALAVVILSWVAFIGAVYAWGGVATVRVRDHREGISLFLPVPMAVVDAAIATSTWVVPKDEWLNLEVDLGDWGPLVSELLLDLDNCPDVTLVEVEDGDEWIRVAKESGALEVQVEDDEGSIRISIPTRSVRRAMTRLARVM